VSADPPAQEEQERERAPEATPDLGEAAAHGVRWSAISRPTIELLQLASMIVLARLVVPAEFGRFAIATIAIEVASLIVGAGLGNALVQRRTADRAHLQAGSALALSIGAAMTIATFAVAMLVVGPLFGHRTGELAVLLSPICLISAIGTVPMALLRRGMRFRRLSEIEIASTAARVGISVVLALAGMSGEALVLGVLGGWVTTAGLASLSAPSPFPRFSKDAVRDLLSFALPMSLVSLTWVGFSNVDYAVIGARLGPIQTGLYFRAYTVAVEYQSKLGVVMSQVGFPVLSRSAGPEQTAHMHRQMVRTLTIVLFPLLVLLAVSAPTLVPFVFGSDWSTAAAPVQVLALGGAATVLIDAAGTVLLANGRPRSLLIFGAGHFVTYGVAVFLISPLGITAIAAAAAVVHSIFVVVSYFLIREGSQETVVRRLWEDIRPAVVASVGLAAAAVPTNWALERADAPAIPYLLGLTLVGGVAYLLVLKVGFAAVWSTQRRIVLRVIPRRSRVRPAPQGA
jgi:O-antigen/teichoic acid export membrane protein